jgi:hypothetical protein
MRTPTDDVLSSTDDSLPEKLLEEAKINKTDNDQLEEAIINWLKENDWIPARISREIAQGFPISLFS